MTLNDEKQRQRLLHDIFKGKLDVARLARRYCVSIAELAQWIGREENRRAIERLCVVADVQTQVMLGRYRQVAAEGLRGPREACVDPSGDRVRPPPPRQGYPVHPPALHRPDPGDERVPLRPRAPEPRGAREGWPGPRLRRVAVHDSGF